MSSTLSSYKRLLPYARDHDRLLVAQLYLDEQEAKILWLNPRIEELKERQEELAQSILAKEAKLAETLVSTDIPEEQKGGLLEALAPEIQKMKNHLDGLKKRANDHIVAREQAQANLSCRQKVEDLLKMLYSSAFDGETPEFPQEDKLEALVDAAKIECARCLKENMTLKEHGRQVSHMNEVMAKLEKLMELENDPAFEQDTQVADNAPLEARWGEAFKVYNDLRDLAKQYMDQSYDLIRQPRLINDQDNFLKFMRNTTQAAERCKVARPVRELILEETKRLRPWLQRTHSNNAQRWEQAMKEFKAANSVLELHAIQLTETRRQILDHVIDPDNCPLVDPLVELPDYSSIQSTRAPVAFQQAGGKTLSKEVHIYIEHLVDSWLSRLRRVNYSPILLPESYTPPKYSDIDGAMTGGDDENVPTLQVPLGFQAPPLIARRAKSWCNLIESFMDRANQNLLPVVNGA